MAENGGLTCNMSWKMVSDVPDIPDDVDVLILSHNRVSSFRGFGKGRNLRVIQADNNELENIDAEEIAGCRKLERLVVSANAIRNIPDIGCLQKLRVLDLAENKIEVLENLETAESLQRVILSRNRIERVEIERPVESVTMLDMRHNIIDHVDLGRSFPLVVSLHMDYCRLVSFAGINELKCLKKLTLAHNKIEKTEVLRLPNLEYLSVANNRIKSLAPFSGLTRLVALDVSANPIDDHGFRIGSVFDNLTVVKAARTNIVDPRLVYEIAPNVEDVDLSNTKIANVQDMQEFVARVSHLRSLNARNTPVTEGLYDGKEKDVSINEYNRLYPGAAVERVKYRASVFGVAVNLGVLDGIHAGDGEVTNTTRESDGKKEVNVQAEESVSGDEKIVAQLESDRKKLEHEKHGLMKRRIEVVESVANKLSELRRSLHMPVLEKRDYSLMTMKELDNTLEKLHEETRQLRRSMERNKRHDRAERKNRRRKNKIDQNKVARLDELISENTELRARLGLSSVEYERPVGHIHDVDALIAELGKDNEDLQKHVRRRAVNESWGKPPKSQRDTVADLVEGVHGCNFWAPLNADQQPVECDDVHDRMNQLPVPAITQKRYKCTKCEKMILMMARVPPYPSPSIAPGSDECQLIEAWLATVLNRRVQLRNVAKSKFFERIIQSERSMPNLRLVLSITNDAHRLVSTGLDSPIVVAEHGRYVLHDLNTRGSAIVMIAAFDAGDQRHDCSSSDVEYLQKTYQAHDSVRFYFRGDESVLALSGSHIIPIYAFRVNL